jgi:hypothetical protein
MTKVEIRQIEEILKEAFIAGALLACDYHGSGMRDHLVDVGFEIWMKKAQEDAEDFER